MSNEDHQKDIRLDRFLSDAGAGTRSEVKTLIRKGRVTVNGMPEKKPERKVSPSSDRIELDQIPITLPEKFVYYLLNKPAGYICAVRDEKEKTVMELIPDHRKDLFPAGRLDKDTEGFLLITNDGMLSHRILSPSRHVDKTYYVETERPLTQEEAGRLMKGVMIGDEKPTLPAVVELLPPIEQTGRMMLTIHEGRYHQIKRMAEAVGTRVTYLKRLKMGGLWLPEDLKCGQCMKISDEMLQKIEERY